MMPTDKRAFEISAKTNIMYHQICEKRYQYRDNFINWIIIALSSSSVIGASKIMTDQTGSTYIVAIGLVITIITSLQLAFRISHKTSLHTELKAKWSMFLITTQKINGSIPDDIPSTFTLLCSEEPACNDRLLLKCYNKARQQYGLGPVNPKKKKS